MNLVDRLSLAAISPELKGTNSSEILWEMAETIVHAYHLQPHLVETIAKVLIDREHLSSTAMGRGIAVPHGRLKGISNVFIGLGLSQKGIEFAAPDECPSHIFFVLLAPEDAIGDHLRVLARICRLFQSADLMPQLLNHSSKEDIFSLLSTKEKKLLNTNDS